MTQYCTICAAEIKPDSQSCPTCGAGIQPSRLIPEKDPSLIWTAQMPYVTSSVVVKQLGMALGGGFVIVFIIITLTSPRIALDIIPILFIIWLALFGLCLLIAAIIQATTRGGPEALFAITPEGIGWGAGETYKKINRLNLVGSIAGSSLAGTGASLINISREMDMITWDEVRSITFQTRERTAVIYRKTLIAPIMLASTQENFEQVKSLIHHYAPPETIR